jgi:hypothetical protein
VGAGEGVELSGWTSFWMMRGSLIFQIFRSTRGKITNFANRCLYVVKDFVIFFMGNHTHIKILEFTNPSQNGNGFYDLRGAKSFMTSACAITTFGSRCNASK